MSLRTRIHAEWTKKLEQGLVAWLHEARETGLTWFRSEVRTTTAATLSAVAILHAIFLVILLWGLRLSTPPIPQELHVSFYGPQQAAERPLAAPPPDVPVMQPPDIVIADDTAHIEVLAAPPSSVLAPRPDPAHPNPVPNSATLGMTINAQSTVIVRLLVSSEGNVLQASFVQSSGQKALDDAIEVFVKEKWRFLPAMLSGGAIQYATTIAIPISAGD